MSYSLRKLDPVIASAVVGWRARFVREIDNPFRWRWW